MATVTPKVEEVMEALRRRLRMQIERQERALEATKAQLAALK